MTELHEKTPDHSSILQMELVAIQLALEQAQHHQEATVLLHSDSSMAPQALPQLQRSDNIGLVTTILGGFQSLAAQKR